MGKTPPGLIDTTTAVPPAVLQPYYRNPRRGDIPAIKRSLFKLAQYKPITVNVGTHTGRPNEVLAGNHTLAAIQELAAEHPDDPAWQSVKVHWGDWDEDTCRLINVADNRTAELGGYDTAELVALLDDVRLDDLPVIGYSPADLAALEQSLHRRDQHTDPDDVPDVPAAPVSQTGQVWVLGEHRLLVGDATDAAEVVRLCGGVAPDCVWTDPPYGLDYVGGNHMLSPTERRRRGGKTIANDMALGVPQLLRAVFGVVAQIARPGAPVYVTAPPGPEFAAFCGAFVAAGLLWRQTLVWVKNAIVMGRSDYHYRSEAILYGFTPSGQGRLGRGGRHWFGGDAQSSVFEFDKPSRSAEHPTMKPVALIDAMLANSLPPGGIVLDPFAGSGSTLIAAHHRCSRCFAVEIDPRYADVILRRFQQHTGIIPTLNGQPTSFDT